MYSPFLLLHMALHKTKREEADVITILAWWPKKKVVIGGLELTIGTASASTRTARPVVTISLFAFQLSS